MQDFIVTKALVEEYKEITAQCFSGVTDDERDRRVYGLFGDADPVVHTMELFASGGRSVISALVYPDEAFSQMELFAESGSVTLLEASIIQLK